MIITALYDKKGRYFNRLSMYENRIVAYRDYYIAIERQRQENPFIKHDDFAILELGHVHNTDNYPVIDSFKEPYEITKEEVEDFIKQNPLNFDKKK